MLLLADVILANLEANLQDKVTVIRLQRIRFRVVMSEETGFGERSLICRKTRLVVLLGIFSFKLLYENRT